ncbi:sorbitol/mannitol transport system substrate-binding protein [Herbaspirillum sp. 1173]|uniref:ABC transporter substrate-binding protein n=1 Tax=Herbaspirillum sp. 1173 TaxID=2817734 RepID=UPI0028549D07|nr:sugar ABC transporter substrate-binding protein [Herbaspirillum sp. 1173]MDR6743316.1 sorbitol/mannitol transport system substrate-binding protein [Herbaspirillum sp. 1173]
MLKSLKKKLSVCAYIAAGAVASTVANAQTTLTIATVNNADMIVMQKLAPQFEKANPDIKLKWVTLEENILRQRITADIATNAGLLDIVTVGTYEVPIWSKLGWLLPVTNIPESYNVDDLIKPVRDILSTDNQLYALPFYGESAFTMYRKDLFDKAGLQMPQEPKWSQIAEFAKKLHNPQGGVYGLCLRGKPGWGENVSTVADLVNSYGGRFVDENWQPQLKSPEWKAGFKFYVDVMQKYGPKGAVSNGYNENLALFSGGHCAMWVDATVAAGTLDDPKQSTVAGKVGYAMAPYETTQKGSHYLWAWNLAIPKSTKKAEAAKKFIVWATSPEYIHLVAKTNGWGRVPPGTRVSTYENPQYQKAAPYSALVLESMSTADMRNPTQKPVPYVGITNMNIPEFQQIGTDLGQQIAAAVAGSATPDEALETAQANMTRALKQGGYLK